MSKPAPATLDDPWGEEAYYAALARRPKHPVRDHLEALQTSTKLTKWFRKGREPEVLKVTAENVIAALNRAGIRPVLLGTYGIGGYRSEARATEDVDVLVRKREVSKAVRVLEEEFPYLEIEDTQVVTRFRNAATLKVALDVMKPVSQATQAVFRNSVAVGKTHRIPTLEMALVSKFMAIISPTRRQAKKHVDVGDFVDVVEHNRAILNLKKLHRLADTANPGSGAKIIRMVEDIDAGRTIHL
jgi:hypothetical protein